MNFFENWCTSSYWPINNTSKVSSNSEVWFQRYEKVLNKQQTNKQTTRSLLSHSHRRKLFVRDKKGERSFDSEMAPLMDWNADCSALFQLKALPFLVKLRNGSALVAKSGMNWELNPASPRKDLTSSFEDGASACSRAWTFSGSGETPSADNLSNHIVGIFRRAGGPLKKHLLSLDHEFCLLFNLKMLIWWCKEIKNISRIVRHWPLMWR